MSTLQIKIDDKEVLDKLKRLAESRGLNMTSYARMKLYEEANSIDQDIEDGLDNYQKGLISPSFTNSKDAIGWLNK